jgi:chemotaxis protein CheX
MEDPLVISFKNALIKAVKNTFSTMIGVAAVPLADLPPASRKKDITGMIGMAGAVRGSASIHLPQSVAFLCMSGMLGMQPESMTSDVRDGIGEVANVIIGGAKSDLNSGGIAFNISTPTVIIGSNYVISSSGQQPVCLPFSANNIPFWVEFIVKK